MYDNNIGRTPFEVFYGRISNCELNFIATQNNKKDHSKKSEERKVAMKYLFMMLLE